MKRKHRFFKAFIVSLTMFLSSCNLMPNLPGFDSSNSNPGTSEHQHNWSEYVVTQEATCTVPGTKERTCAECGKVERASIPALGHSYGDLVVVTPASVGQSGLGYRECSVCHERKDETIPALVASFTVSDICMERSGDWVYLIFTGICENVEPENFKWALSLYSYSDRAFVYGEETPADYDFIYAPEIDESGNFTVRIEISNIFANRNLLGIYNVYAGPRSKVQAFTNSFAGTTGNYVDNNFRYYFRNDSEVGSYLSICTDELPPYFHLEDALVLKEADDVYLFIEGRAVDQYSPIENLRNAIAQVTPFIQFQSASNNYYRPVGSGDREVEGFTYEFRVYTLNNVIMVNLRMRINFMLDNAATVYNTHLNLRDGNRQANCVMETDFERDYELDLPSYGSVKIQVFSHPNGANTVDNSYGNFGVRINDYHY